MKFYHGTTIENWRLIQQEKMLWGVRNIEGYHPSRCTYLAVEKKDAQLYGDVVLEVEYNPYINPTENNYIDGCWQVRVYEPIPLKSIRKINIMEE